MRPRVRIGAVSYLNTRPLVHGFEQGLGADRLELSYDVPAGLGVAMAEGRLDIALLPVIELARIPDLEVVPGLGIVTRGPSRSVLLIGKRPVTEMRSVALDAESRSSNALLQVLFAEVWNCNPRFGLGGLDLEQNLRDWDGVLRIGDKALFEAVPPGCHVYDLGQVWSAATGLPFLYAAWIARRGAVDREIYRLLHDSRRAGSRVIDRIAEEFSWNGMRDPRLARDYLTHNIQFRLGSAELQALRRFLEASHALGLIDHVPQVHLAMQRWSSCHEAAAGTTS
jgi:chorismate dehydratase